MVSRLISYPAGQVQSSGSVESVKNPLTVPTTLHAISGFWKGG